MFDAKSLLNMVMGAGQQAGQQGGLQGMLGQVLGGLQNQAQSAGQQAQGGLGGMLGQVLGGVQNQAQNVGQQAQDAAAGAAGALGGLGGLIGSVLGQAGQGLNQAGQDVNQATGGAAGDLLSRVQQQFGQAMPGANPQDLLAKAKELIANNPGMAAAIAAGAGAMVLGTKTGRGLAGGAAKLGGLALIGGLAYNAYTNWQNGRALTATQPGQIAAAPAGSGYAEGDGDDNDRALLMVRAMVAAAAADGEIDLAEQQRIMGNLQAAGLADEAQAFLNQEFQAPLGVDALVAMASSPEIAAQIYTAARLAIDPDTAAEQGFLTELAGGLGLDAELVAHIDAAAASVVAQPA